MPWTENDHTFVICAYRQSPFLESCIRSLKNQVLHSRILMATATPSPWLLNLAQRYAVPLYVNSQKPSIGGDWNFALSTAPSQIVTLAHQDDLYEPDYLKKALECLNKAEKPLIFFSDYYDLRDHEKTRRNLNLGIKKWMLFPLRFHGLQKSRWMRRRILSFGNPVGCPSVTYVKESIPIPLFDSSFSCNLDWAAWVRLSKLSGSFVYCPEPLVQHRIHPGSTTTKIIHENGRSAEDLRVFRQFWPNALATVIARIYSYGERSNRV